MGPFSGRVYCSRQYKELGEGRFEFLSKEDITEEFENACLDYMARLAGKDGHKYLADGLAALVERVNARNGST